MGVPTFIEWESIYYAFLIRDDPEAGNESITITIASPSSPNLFLLIAAIAAILIIAMSVCIIYRRIIAKRKRMMKTNALTGGA